MGIRGLTSLMNKYSSEVYERFELRDSTLIIDGYNLANDLYFTGQVDIIFGGDYPKYCEIVTGFFRLLKARNVTPIVIMDGPFDEYGAKKNTLRKRHGERIQRCRQAVEYLIQTNKMDTNARVFPSFAVTVFEDTAKLCGIEVIQTFIEADSFVAYKAGQLKCPVLSNDSDFFIHDLKFGFIPFEKFPFSGSDFRQILFDGSFKNPIICQIFFLEKFLALFPGLEADLLPLFATLMGNDFIDKQEFSRFFAIDDVLSLVEPENEQSLRSKIRNSVDMYNTERFLIHNFDHGFTTSNHEIDLATKNFNAPAWLLNQFRNGQVHPTIARLLINREIYCVSLTGDPKSGTMFDCCEDIFRAIYNIILLFWESQIDHNTNLSIVEWNCKFYGQMKREVFVDENSASKLPSLSEIGDLTVAERRKFFYSIINLDDPSMIRSLETLVPSELQLYVLCLYYLASKNDNEDIGFRILDSLIISAYTRTYPLLKKRDSANDGAEQFLRNYGRLNWSMRNDFLKSDLVILHELTRFNEVLFALTLLNSILDCGFSNLRMENLYGGTAVWNTIKKHDGNFSALLSKIAGIGAKMNQSFYQNITNFRASVLEM
uniref:Asteroid domain-containing protein n=1 Tax=Romanomermis culicivorax TaxID=13658 RepID=A0A915IKK9_ROMCU